MMAASSVLFSGEAFADAVWIFSLPTFMSAARVRLSTNPYEVVYSSPEHAIFLAHWKRRTASRVRKPNFVVSLPGEPGPEEARV